jgi:hypothetical protein
MTATTARLTHTGDTSSFRRGMILGAVATLILWLGLLAAVAFATWQPAPTTKAPGVQAPAAPIQVDQNHPIHRPGGVTVY